MGKKSGTATFLSMCIISAPDPDNPKYDPKLNFNI